MNAVCLVLSVFSSVWKCGPAWRHQEQSPEQNKPEPQVPSVSPWLNCTGSGLQEDLLGYHRIKKEHRGVLNADSYDNQGLSVNITAGDGDAGLSSPKVGNLMQSAVLWTQLSLFQHSVSSKRGQESFLLILHTTGALSIFLASIRPSMNSSRSWTVTRVGEGVSKQVLKRWIEGVYLA